VDAGDAAIVGGHIVPSLTSIERYVHTVVSRGGVPIVLGGDHTITFPDASGVARHHGFGRVALVHFDAHADTGEDQWGQLHGHGTPMRRLVESGAVPVFRFVQIGLRGYWPPPETVAWMRGQRMRSYFMQEIVERGLDVVVDEAVAHIEEARRSGGALVCEYRVRHRGGEWIWLEQRGVFLRDEEDAVRRMLGSLGDVTERKRVSSAMAWQASHDPLTGLVNRHEFEERVARLLFNRRGQRHHALLYIDLDQFKVVNDTCGHQAGDQLLRQLTGLVAATVRETDTLARLGGDEFGLLLVDCAPDQALAIAEKLIGTINEFRFVWDDKTFTIGASIGLVEITQGSDSVAALFSAADSACYAAKDKGRNRVVVYREGDQELAARQGEMTWVSRITKALEDGRFVLHRQSIDRVSPRKNGRQHYELLVRMVDEDGREIPPGSFIPAAERYNLMPALDRWVIREAFRMISQHRGEAIVASINLSGVTLSSERFVEYVHDQLDEFGVSPESVCYEITETAAIANLQRAREFIAEMHKLGCRIALDDFGSGYCGLHYLRQFTIDKIKVDKTIIDEACTSEKALNILRGVSKIASEIGMTVTVEGVDNQEKAELVNREKCADELQGFFFSRPVPAHLARRRSRAGTAAGDRDERRRVGRRGRARDAPGRRVRQGAQAVRPPDRRLPGGLAPLRADAARDRGRALGELLRGVVR
jgi:diguanylate cyclase (GGDEF)-like protein